MHLPQTGTWLSSASGHDAVVASRGLHQAGVVSRDVFLSPQSNLVQEHDANVASTTNCRRHGNGSPLCLLPLSLSP